MFATEGKASQPEKLEAFNLCKLVIGLQAYVFCSRREKLGL